MAQCMICGKERPDGELRGRICSACSDAVRRDAGDRKVREKRASDRALRGRGQPGETPERKR